jgi:hypothetical protein
MIRLLYHNFLSILDDLPQKVLEDIKDYFKDKAFASLQLRMPLYCLAMFCLARYPAPQTT